MLLIVEEHRQDPEEQLTEAEKQKSQFANPPEFPEGPQKWFLLVDSRSDSSAFPAIYQS